MGLGVTLASNCLQAMPRSPVAASCTLTRAAAAQYLKLLSSATCEWTTQLTGSCLPCRRSLKGLSDADVAALQRLVDEQVTENLGMPMIYAIVAAAQEWLRDKVLRPCRISATPAACAQMLHCMLRPFARFLLCTTYDTVKHASVAQ